MNKLLAPLLVAAACLLAAGCANRSRLPREVDLSRAAIVSSDADAVLALDGPSGKGSGASAGAVKGGGTGLLIGGLACMAAGPLAPLCMGMVVPTSTAIGAVGGAVVGAVKSEHAEAVDAKRSLLQAELAAPANRARLASHLQQKSRDSLGVELPLADTGADALKPEWALQIVMTQLATVGRGPDAAYSLRASASLEVTRNGDARPVFAKRYQALSTAKLTTAGWSANAAEPVRSALDDMAAILATKMVSDLKLTNGP